MVLKRQDIMWFGLMSSNQASMPHMRRIILILFFAKKTSILLTLKMCQIVMASSVGHPVSLGVLQESNRDWMISEGSCSSLILA